MESGTGSPFVSVPNRSDPIASVSLCARCHLQGDASLLLEPGARGIVPPGGDMLERRAVYVAAEPTDEIGFVSQAERFVLSRCFTASLTPGRTPLTCVTCHDPHRSAFGASERAVVRGKCVECHASATETTRMCSLPPEARGSQGCVDCHMRRTPPFDVASVEIHDHWIRKAVAPPSRIGALRTKESQDGRLAVFAWPGRARPSYADDPGLWMMALTSLGRRDLALPFADREPGPNAARLPTYHHLRGTLFEQATRLDDARAAYERALAIDAGQAETAVNLGALLGVLGRARSGVEHLDNVIRNHPQAEGALRNRGMVSYLRGNAAGFAADLEAAFAILPQATVARALAQHYAKIGRDDLARRWDQAARKLQPDESIGVR
jgi:predicted CXXCH cytochrome family protein